MTRTELIDTLNHTAACLLVNGERYPEKAREMQRLAVRLQIMAMDMEEPWQEDGLTGLSGANTNNPSTSRLT
jgi:hypothetical protein